MTDAPEPPAAPPRFVAFQGEARIADGALAAAAIAAFRALQSDPATAVLVFDSEGRIVDLDLRGGEADVLARLPQGPAEAPKRGRPRLGVVAREVTLLPRHWDWLAAQPGGASVTLRRLIDAARKDTAGPERMRARRDAAYRFMSAMAGDRPGFEEASRALFAGDRPGLTARIADWPADVRAQILGLLDGGE